MTKWILSCITFLIFFHAISAELTIKDLDHSSYVGGRQRSLYCEGQVVNKKGDISWLWRLGNNGPLTEFNNEIPYGHIYLLTVGSVDNLERSARLDILNSPLIPPNIEFVCITRKNDFQTADEIQNDLRSEKRSDYQTKAVKFKFLADIIVQKPTVIATKEISARCLGYPARTNDRLKWFYTPKGSDQLLEITNSTISQIRIPNSDTSLSDFLRIGIYIDAAPPRPPTGKKNYFNNYVKDINPAISELILTQKAKDVIGDAKLTCSYMYASNDPSANAEDTSLPFAESQGILNVNAHYRYARTIQDIHDAATSGAISLSPSIMLISTVFVTIFTVLISANS